MFDHNGLGHMTRVANMPYTPSDSAGSRTGGKVILLPCCFCRYVQQYLQKERKLWH